MLFEKTVVENKAERKNRGSVVFGGDGRSGRPPVKVPPAANFRRRSTQIKK
jgi:hypothetical protein